MKLWSGGDARPYSLTDARRIRYVYFKYNEHGGFSFGGFGYRGFAARIPAYRAGGVYTMYDERECARHGGCGCASPVAAQIPAYR